MNNQENQPGSPMPGDDVRVQNAGTSAGSPGFSSADAGNAGSSTSGNRKGGAAGSQARGAAGQGATASANSEAGDKGAQTSGSGQREGQESSDQQGNQMLNTALESGKKWIEDSGVLNSVNQLPQSVKEWGSRAVSRVGDLTTTQKLVGGALLAVGIGYLATRKNSGKSEKPASRYSRQGSGSYGRSSGYQAPDASNSRRTSVGSGRSDSGSAYGNSSAGSGSYGNSAAGSGSYNSGSSYGAGASSGSGFGSSTSGGDFSSRTSESSYRSKNDDFRSIE